ncbi:MAG: RidA family protein [Proteobacteria bacterium]|nr:RidA family protein [Pseudomonadota bacterium]
MVTRSNPDVGYLSNDVFEAYAFTQTIKAGNNIYLSGIAPLRGSNDNIELVGEGDIRAQVSFCLEVLKGCLTAEGIGLENWVAHTVYGTDMKELHKTADIFVDVFRDYPPTSTWVEIKGLFVPGQMVEITGFAVVD